MPQLSPVDDFWKILMQKVCKGWQMSVSEVALDLRIPRTLASLDTGELPTAIRDVDGRVRSLDDLESLI